MSKQARRYALVDDMLDRMIDMLRQHDDPVTTHELAETVLAALARLDPDDHDAARRDKILAQLLATAIQRLVYGPGVQP